MKIEMLNEFISKVNRNKLKYTLYILVTILLGVTFIFSNNIAVKLFKEPNEQLLYEVKDVPSIGGNMTYAYESFKYNGLKMKNNVNITFWSYVDSKKDNISRKAMIYFKSNKKTYACDTVLIKRIDLYKSNRDHVKGTNEKYGFMVNFSPLIMKDGNYQLGIYTEENSEEKAFVWTPYTFKKEGNSFLEIEHNSQQEREKFKNVISNKDVNVKIKTISATRYKDYLYIDGYALKENFNAKNNDIFVELINSKGDPIIVDTVKMNANNIGGTYDHHPDVLPQEFNSEEYLNSGFATKIPLTLLNEDTYEISVIIESGGQLYKEKSSEKYIHRVNVNSRVESKEINISNNVNYYIESIDARSDIINISGWIVEEDLNSASQEVYVHFKNEKGNIQTFKANSAIREDIAKWKGDKYLYTGFILSIPTKNLDEEKYTVFASVKRGDGFDTAAKPFIEEEKIYLNRIDIGQQVTGLDVSKSDKVQYYIETLENTGSWISAAGWIFKDETPSVDHNIYIKFENQNNTAFIYKAAINGRSDIAEWRGDGYLYSGFYVNIPITILPEGEYWVTILIETDQVEEAVKPYIKEVKKIRR